MPFPIAVVAVGAVVAVAGGVVVWQAAERRRREGLEHFALTRGLKFDVARRGGEQALAPSIALFAKGHSRRWGYTLAGTRNGTPYTAFEYAWTTGGGQHSHRHRVHGVLWEQNGDAFPVFVLEPEDFFARVGHLFGVQDIDFDDAPEFSRLYALKGTDEPAVRRLFTPGLRTTLAAESGQYVAGGGRYLFWYAKGRLPNVERLDEWIERGDRVRRQFFERG